MNFDLLLVDGRHLLWRAVDSHKELSIESEGEIRKTGAIYGFLAVLTRVRMQLLRPTATIVVCWDEGKRLKRRSLYPGYKSHRGDGEIPLDRLELIRSMREQEARLKTLLSGLGIGQASSPGWEADDVMGTLAARFRRLVPKVGIFTGDRDLLQCIRSTVSVIRPGKQGALHVETPQTLREQYGVSPKGFLYMKALAGDPGDGIPGVRGVGPKLASKVVTAVELPGADPTLNDVIAMALATLPVRFHEQLKDRETIRLWYELSRIRTSVALRFIPKANWDRKRIVAELMDLQFRSWVQPGRLSQLLRLRGDD